MNAEITIRGMLDMQVCVPENWTDDEVLNFAEIYNSCGTEYGWHIRKEGSKLLNGDSERVNCQDRKGYIHIMLDA